MASQRTLSLVASTLIAKNALSTKTGKPLRHKLLTLIFVQDLAKSKILLGLKKRGFGINKWNGLGGKVEPNETIYQGALRSVLSFQPSFYTLDLLITLQVFFFLLREATEESGLLIKSLNKIGFIQFQFESKVDEEVLDVHVFTCRDFEGVPRECDEIRPDWFDMNASSIPFDSMWKDDRLWFSYLLKDQPFHAYFLFGDDEETIIDYVLEACELEQLDF